MTDNTPKLRVLFVDDEAEILNGLRLTLRKERKHFDFLFAECGAEALLTLKNHPVDVVCTDLKMPDTDGSELLARMVESYPGVGRVVLSGHADDKVALRALSLAHRLLVKPTDRSSIVDALMDVRATLEPIERADLREAIVGATCLPPAPELHARLQAQLASEHADVKTVTETLCQDPAMAAKVLQFANSGYISAEPNIVSVADATEKLGLSTLHAIAPHVGCSKQPAASMTSVPSRSAGLRLRSRLTAQVAGHIALEKQLDVNLATTAALLSGTGMLLLETRAPDLAHSTRLKATTEDRPLQEVQQREFGVDHTVIAASLLGSWGLPLSIVDLVRSVHSPKCPDSTGFNLRGAMHIAYYLAHQTLNQLAADQATPPQHLDLSYVHMTGISAELREWNDFTRHLAQQMLKEGDYKAA